jgi:ABC-type uncharacterized transport system permease subunit
MDLTDITISPMIPVGIGVVSAAIKIHTGWSWAASVAVGIVPGAVIGFLAGVLLFWTITGICLVFCRLTGRGPYKRPD